MLHLETNIEGDSLVPLVAQIHDRKTLGRGTVHKPHESDPYREINLSNSHASRRKSKSVQSAQKKCN